MPGKAGRACHAARLARTGRALVLAASTLAAASQAAAGDFTQQECKGISGLAGAVVRRVGKDTLSVEFRQSFRNWLGEDMRCDGPKEIVIVTPNDDATYATIRSELLQLPKPISLQKAGLTPVVKPNAATPTSSPQKRSDAASVPAGK